MVITISDVSERLVETDGNYY